MTTALAIANLAASLVNVALMVLLVLPRLRKLHPQEEA